ncbi:glycerate kinase [Corynebacterium kalidii]|uniref:Glycerate kinase n=1 Tax=Corynebacterium kalidii TaxID=2931982 RepID=A0A9X1WJP8_9CORY|nr:glycerate kinase [Corynebacterium kalidii]MCJ7857582.1 glycerate kinase [Corynebacterium kalidii]
MTLYLPERILVCPSGFKESMSAVDVADAIAAGVLRTLPGVRVDTFPVPDGGEGTVEILSRSPGTTVHTATVTGPTGEPVTARWLEYDDRSTAVIEMAQAAGLRLIPTGQRDPGSTTSRGVGELIGLALDRGIREIIVGCGDSGTCDGGAGALSALGARVLDDDGRELPDGGLALSRAAEIDVSGLRPELADCTLTLACNLHNVLTGDNGVAAVFGPQKGATRKQVKQLGKAMRRWADVLQWTFGPTVDLHRAPGTGASGGLGAAVMALGGRAGNRFEVLLGRMPAQEDLDSLISAADLVVTAEGAIDFQTPKGKVPAEIARRARATGVPVFALAGSLGDGAPDVHDMGIGALQSIMTVPMAMEDALRNGRDLLTEAAARATRMLLLGCVVSGRREAEVRSSYTSAVGAAVPADFSS